MSSFVMGCGGGAFLAPPGLAGVGDMKAVDRVGGPLREPRGSDPINPPPPRLGLRRLGVLAEGDDCGKLSCSAMSFRFSALDEPGDL